MLPAPRFRGKYRRRCAQLFARSVASASARRLRYGPTLPSWNWAVELGTAVLRDQLRAAMALSKVEEQREFLDGMIVGPAPTHAMRDETVNAELQGTWHEPGLRSSATMLYLHGGGFAVYPKAAYANFLGMIVKACNAIAFAVDYRLAPEHAFPAALEDARTAYLWMLERKVDPTRLVLAGDSAGGNLTLALLCDLRDRGLPLPALGIALSPATDLDRIRPGMEANERYDWITGPVALAWRDWYCRPEQRALPLVSPIYANLRGLPPIYIQAGGAEVLWDSIAAFAGEAKRQDANVTLEPWADMNHVFQFFGSDAPQSAHALQRMRETIERHIHPM